MAVFVLAGAFAGRAAEPPTLRVDSNMVLVGATVLDPHDRPVRGLTRDDFRLFDDNLPRPIATFAEQDLPLSLAVVFDTSGSMADKLPLLRGALAALLSESNPEDEFALVRFADRAETAVPWTADAGQVQSALFSHPARGRTSLWDAVDAALRQFRHARNPRRAMVLFSDGGDNFSRFSRAHITGELAEADVQVYAIDTTGLLAASNRNADEPPDVNPLAVLCEGAGGRYFALESPRDIPGVARQIGRELRSQYVLGYMPSLPSRDGKRHAIRLQVRRPEGSPRLSVFWRRGYRAPSL